MIKNKFKIELPKSAELSKNEVKRHFKELQDYIKEESPVTLGKIASWVEENEDTRLLFNIIGGKKSSLYRSGYSKDPFLRKGILRYLKHLGYKMYLPGELISPVSLKEKKIR